MLCIAVVLAPFFFGSREPTTVTFWCLWLGVAALATSVAAVRKPHALLILGIVLVALGYAFILHEQLADHPWFAAPNAIWADASRLLGTTLQPSVSIAKNAPFYGLGAIIANLLALLIGLVIGTDRHLARRLLVVAGLAGAAYAAYGIFAVLATPTSVLWREKEAYLGLVTGTFINRNTAATYFGSMAIIWLLLLLEDIRSRLPPGVVRWRLIVATAFTTATPATLTRFLLYFVCLSALLMTRSRGGVIVSTSAMLLAFLLYFYRDLIGHTKRAFSLGFLAALSLLILQFFAGAAGRKLDMEGLTDPGRIATYKATLRIIADHPWFGTGLGTFAFAFPTYRSDESTAWGIWDLAHSTPLQMAAEVGLPLTLLVGAAWAVALAILLRAVFIRRRDTILPLAALIISFIALAHSTIDFSLQIAGYSIVAFALLGIGLAQSFRSPPRGPQRKMPWEAGFTPRSAEPGARSAPHGS